MPRLMKLYIHQSLVGVGIATIFVAMLLAMNVGNIWYLATNTTEGPFAVLVLWAHFALLFAGVQFAISVMRLASEDDAPTGGTRIRPRRLVRVTAEAPSRVPRIGKRSLRQR